MVVYGVEIPGQEGKAGMAAIDSTEPINIHDLGQKLIQDLPGYARPLFIRLVSHLEHTGTFKAIKSTLIQEGFNVNKLTDKIYYFDQNSQSYLDLTPNVYENILNCKARI